VDSNGGKSCFEEVVNQNCSPSGNSNALVKLKVRGGHGKVGKPRKMRSVGIRLEYFVG